MDKITTVGLDLAKSVFHLVGFNARGQEVKKKVLRRSQVLSFFGQLPASVVAMEACAGAHYWARALQRQGHTVRLIPAQHVKAYVRGQKNDYNDARAIAEAVGRPGMRFVAVKTLAQQDLQALHRLRQGCLKERTALVNRLRGVLGEYGIVLPQGVAVLRRRLPELLEEADNGLSDTLRGLLAQAYQRLRELDAHIEHYTRQLQAQGQHTEACQRLQGIPGYGPILASAFYAALGDGRGFGRGRDVAASLGLVPRQHSTGGKPTLLGITKRGDRHLRSLLVHGARAVLLQAPGKDDRLSRWAQRIRDERGFNKAVVALANKLARIGWAILRNHSTYQPA